jgi:hypothetical protein
MNATTQFGGALIVSLFGFDRYCDTMVIDRDGWSLIYSDICLLVFYRRSGYVDVYRDPAVVEQAERSFRIVVAGVKDTSGLVVIELRRILFTLENNPITHHTHIGQQAEIQAIADGMLQQWTDPLASC